MARKHGTGYVAVALPLQSEQMAKHCETRSYGGKLACIKRLQLANAPLAEFHREFHGEDWDDYLKQLETFALERKQTIILEGLYIRYCRKYSDIHDIENSE